MAKKKRPLSHLEAIVPFPSVDIREPQQSHWSKKISLSKIDKFNNSVNTLGAGGHQMRWKTSFHRNHTSGNNSQHYSGVREKGAPMERN